MTATEALERRIDELCSENERLRKELEAEHALAETLGHHHEYAQAENEKLRELVRDMMQAWWACDNEKCPRHDKRCEEGQYCAFDECARELWVEVDE